MEFEHSPVMLSECMEALAVKPDGIYVDGTAGGGGHSSAIAGRLSGGRLISLDKDPDAVCAAGKRLSVYGCAEVVQSDFANVDIVLSQRGIDKIDGMMMDLGVSSYQIDNAERGFSYRNDGKLDMRMSREGISAYDIVNGYPVEEITRILYEYGEEKFASRIAKNIEKARTADPITTTLELAGIVKDSIPASKRDGGDPSKRTFQAIRIAVNSELDSLSTGLDKAFSLLKPGGRLVILTFHSLEDRMVKQRFAGWCKGCICPPDFPVCVCGRKPEGVLVNKKAVEASNEELAVNKRSKSAKLRAIEKI